MSINIYKLASDGASSNSTALAFQFLWTWFSSVLAADLALAASRLAFTKVNIWTESGSEISLAHSTET